NRPVLGLRRISGAEDGKQQSPGEARGAKDGSHSYSGQCGGRIQPGCDELSPPDPPSVSRAAPPYPAYCGPRSRKLTGGYVVRCSKVNLPSSFQRRTVLSTGYPVQAPTNPGRTASGARRTP